MSKEIHFLEDGYYVDKLEKEIQQLKEELKYTVPIVEHNKIVSEKNKENKQLKEVIDQIREYIKNSSDMSVVNNYSFPDKPVIDKRAKKDLLQILDKAKEKEH